MYKLLSRLKFTIRLGVLCAIISLLISFQEMEGVVIVHPSNATNEMTISQAKLFYTRKIKRYWPNNMPIRPVALKGKTGLQTSFYHKVLRMSQEEVEGYFKQRQFANAESAPVEVSSESEMVEYVSNNGGAIGFVSASVAEANKGKVKILCRF